MTGTFSDMIFPRSLNIGYMNVNVYFSEWNDFKKLHMNDSIVAYEYDLRVCEFHIPCVNFVVPEYVYELLDLKYKLPKES